jgi:glucosamine kinase
VSLAGRVSELHPVIAESMRAGLPPGTAFAVSASRGHHAAARIAARAAASASPR